MAAPQAPKIPERDLYLWIEEPRKGPLLSEEYVKGILFFSPLFSCHFALRASPVAWSFATSAMAIILRETPIFLARRPGKWNPGSLILQKKEWAKGSPRMNQRKSWAYLQATHVQNTPKQHTKAFETWPDSETTVYRKWGRSCSLNLSGLLVCQNKTKQKNQHALIFTGPRVS